MMKRIAFSIAALMTAGALTACSSDEPSYDYGYKPLDVMSVYQEKGTPLPATTPTDLPDDANKSQAPISVSKEPDAVSSDISLMGKDETPAPISPLTEDEGEPGIEPMDAEPEAAPQLSAPASPAAKGTEKTLKEEPLEKRSEEKFEEEDMLLSAVPPAEPLSDDLEPMSDETAEKITENSAFDLGSLIPPEETPAVQPKAPVQQPPSPVLTAPVLKKTAVKEEPVSKTLMATIAYATGESALSKNDLERIKDVARIFKEGEGKRLKVVGYGYRSPKLANDRAIGVMKALRNAGVPAGKVIAVAETQKLPKGYKESNHTEIHVEN